MISNQEKQKIVEEYVNAYNNFDIEGMLKNLHENVVFRNISNGIVDLMTIGIDEFERQAEEAKLMFSARSQKITETEFEKDKVEVGIDYKGTLAIDLPNGLTAGNEFQLSGKSVFRFSDGKIIEIEDIH